MERILLGWVEELGVPIRRGLRVSDLAQDDAGVDVHLPEGEPLRTAYLVGANGGRSVIRRVASIDFVGAGATRSHLIAEVEVTEETPTGIRLDDVGIHAMNVMEDRRTVGMVGRAGDRPRRAGCGQPRLETRPGRPGRLTRRPSGQLPGGAAPATARVLRNVMAQALLQRGDARTEAMRDTISDLLSFGGPRAQLAGLLSGLDVCYNPGEGHPLLGRRMPDLDLTTAHGPRRVFQLLHDARPVLLNLGEPDSIDVTPWTDRVQHIHADHTGTWELPVIGTVTAPVAVLIRPDGHVAWVGDETQAGLRETLTTWFGRSAKKDGA